MNAAQERWIDDELSARVDEGHVNQRQAARAIADAPLGRSGYGGQPAADVKPAGATREHRARSQSNDAFGDAAKQPIPNRSLRVQVDDDEVRALRGRDDLSRRLTDSQNRLHPAVGAHEIRPFLQEACARWELIFP